jgi:hypothetical protein
VAVRPVTMPAVAPLGSGVAYYVQGRRAAR